MLRVHSVSDRLMPPSLYAIDTPLPGRPAMPGTGVIVPQPSDTPGLVPNRESPMPRTDTPGLPGSEPAPILRPDAPDPGVPLPGGGSDLPAEDIPESPRQDPDYPAAIPVPA